MHDITTRIAIATMTLFLAAFAFGQDRPEVFGIVVPFDRVSMDATTSAEQSVAAACLTVIPWFEWEAVPANIRSTASPAVASARPASMKFSMSVPTQGGQAGAGPVRGDMVGHLYARLTGIDRTTPLWLVTYDWTFAAGPDTFTATLDGTYDSEDRALLLAGIVDEGRLRGARIVVSATHSDIAGGHYRGTFQVHQD